MRGDEQQQFPFEEGTECGQHWVLVRKAVCLLQQSDIPHHRTEHPNLIRDSAQPVREEGRQTEARVHAAEEDVRETAVDDGDRSGAHESARSFCVGVRVHHHQHHAAQQLEERDCDSGESLAEEADVGLPPQRHQSLQLRRMHISRVGVVLCSPHKKPIGRQHSRNGRARVVAKVNQEGEGRQQEHAEAGEEDLQRRWWGGVRGGCRDCKVPHEDGQGGEVVGDEGNRAEDEREVEEAGGGGAVGVEDEDGVQG